MFQFSVDLKVHIDNLAVFVAHALGHTHIMLLRILLQIKMHSDVSEPTDLLVANAASYSEMLISHVHCDLYWLHDGDALRARHTVIYHYDFF